MKVNGNYGYCKCDGSNRSGQEKAPASGERTMATTITKVQKGKKKSTNAAEQHKEDLLWLKKHVGRDFTKWREFNADATLGDLLEFLEEVQEELLGFNDDDVIEEIRDELGIADEYLSEWDASTDHETVLYRLENVEEDKGHVEELIEELSPSFRVSRLPKWKFKSK